MENKKAPQFKIALPINEAPRKLKILCLHGFNNHKEVFTYMTRGFREILSEVADFHFIDGPFDIDEFVIPPEPALVERGFKPPFKGWFSLIPLGEDLIEK